MTEIWVRRSGYEAGDMDSGFTIPRPRKHRHRESRDLLG